MTSERKKSDILRELAMFFGMANGGEMTFGAQPAAMAITQLTASAELLDALERENADLRDFLRGMARNFDKRAG